MNRFARRPLTQGRLTRTARGAAAAAVLALIVAAPAAAGQPTRTVSPLTPFVIPAGRPGRSMFEAQPSRGFTAETDFSDGRVRYSIYGVGAYVNLDTGKRFATEDTSSVVVHSDPATEIDVYRAKGQNTWPFLPGDVGPFGVVDSPAMYHIIGTMTQTWDNNTNRSSGFSYSGAITDVCAALS